MPSDTSSAAVTVKAVVPLIPLVGSFAVIVIVPTATDVAIPLEPKELLMVAIEVSEESHITVVVKS